MRLTGGLRTAAKPSFNVKKFLHIFLSEIYNKNMYILCSSSDSDRQTERRNGGATLVT